MPLPSVKNNVPRSQLAPQAKKPPQFSVSLKDSKGQTFLLADPKATRALVACMDMEAALGGAASHWGGPSAFAEIMSALHALIFKIADKQSVDWFELFHLINDAGHCENGLYALKANYNMAGLDLGDLKKFRSIESPLTGHGETHLFPEGVYLSNGPLASTVAQAQGLAMADKLLGNSRMTVAVLSDGACMEGEAKEALSAIPGFAGKNQLNPFLLIISNNNTKLTGRIDQDSYSMEPYFQSLSALGWGCSFISKGNDLKIVFQAIQNGLEKAFKNPKKPTALIFKTCKGFGVKKTMEDSSGGHGFPLKDPEELPGFIKEIYEGEKPPLEILNWSEEIRSRFKTKKQPAPKPPLKKTQIGISQAFIEQKQKGMPIVSISSDLQGSTGMALFRKEFPQYSFDVGVAEANMISAAVGFSKQGFIPVVDTFSQFAITKGSLPLIMSALSQAPVIGIFSHAGFQDAADGASHQALSYFAKTCSLPHTKVYALSCAEEAYYFLSQAVEEFYKEKQSGQIPENQIFFLGRETFPESFGAPSYVLNKAQVLLDHSKGSSPVLIVSCGPLLQEALRAGQQLQKQGQGAVVINNPSVSDPDVEMISRWLQLCDGRLLTVEEHQIQGGMASTLLLALKESGATISRFKALAVRGRFGRSAYKAVELYKHFGLDKDSIVQAVLEF